MLKKIYQLTVTSGVLLMLPLMEVMAQSYRLDSSSTGKQFLSSITNFINQIIIPFLLGLGFLVFVFGMFWYFIAGGADEEKRGKGKDLIIYAVLGFVLIFTFWGLVNLVARFTGLEQNTIQGTVPTAPGPR